MYEHAHLNAFHRTPPCDVSTNKIVELNKNNYICDCNLEKLKQVFLESFF